MVRRILYIAGGVVIGTFVLALASRSPLLWGLLGNRQLDTSTAEVRDVLQLVQENYVDPAEATYPTLTKSALRGMVQGLDPHSEFLDADGFKSIEDEIGGQFGGIGVQVELRNGRVVVVAPIAGTPGDRAGIVRGDEIVGVDGTDIAVGTPLSDVVSRLRGPPGSEVTVSLDRPSSNRTFDVNIVREVIKVESVRNAQLLPGGIGLIQITEFTRPTGDEFRKAVKQLEDEGMTSLILDLRNNPGGLLESAVDVAGVFFRKGELVVYTQGRKPEDRQEFRASGDEGGPLQVPLALIINAGSASAAEIVAGALKDTGRAVIVGERSFGKGSVQSIFSLPGGDGLRLTTARYYTPSGVSINEIGVTPQIEVVMTPEEDAVLSRQWARPDLTDPAEFKARYGMAPIVDRQLEAAEDALRGVMLLDARDGRAAGAAANP